MSFNWETAPYKTRGSAQVCDVPGVGRLHAFRQVPRSRTFCGNINGKPAIIEVGDIETAKRELERVATRILNAASLLTVTDLNLKAALDNSPVTKGLPEISKPCWREGRFGTHLLVLGNGALAISIFYSMTRPADGGPIGYTVRLGSQRLKKQYESVDEAKAAALAMARRFVAQMNDELILLMNEPKPR